MTCAHVRARFFKHHQIPTKATDTNITPTAATAPITPSLIGAIGRRYDIALEDAALDVEVEVLATRVETLAELLDRLPDIEVLWLATSAWNTSVSGYNYSLLAWKPLTELLPPVVASSGNATSTKSSQYQSPKLVISSVCCVLVNCGDT